MSDDGEIERLTEIERITNGKPSYFDMDAAFCTRMHAAIAAGLDARRLVSSRRPELRTRDTSRTKLRGIIARATSGDKTGKYAPLKNKIQRPTARRSIHLLAPHAHVARWRFSHDTQTPRHALAIF
jgi:hypothetical protein